MTFRNKVFNAFAWSVFSSWGTQAISFGVFLVLARLLQPKDFGLVAMAYVFTTFMSVMIDQGFSEAIIQSQNISEIKLNTAFWTAILVALILILITVIASGLIASIYKEPQLKPILRWLSIGYLFSALNSTQQAILRRHLQFKALSLRLLIAAIIGGCVAIPMALNGWGVWSLVANNLTVSFTGLVILWSASEWRPMFQFSKIEFHHLFKFSSSIVGSRIIDMSTRNVDNLIIGYFLGSTALGYYTVAFRLITALTTLLTGASSPVALSTFSKLQDRPKQLRDSFYIVTEYAAAIAIPAFIGVILLSHEFITLLYGPKWHPSALVMQVLALMGILYIVSSFYGPILIAIGRPGLNLIYMTSRLVVATLLFLIAVKYGIVAVAIACVMSLYITAPIAVYFLRNLIGLHIRTYIALFRSPLVAAAFMTIVIILIKSLVTDHVLSKYIAIVMISIAGIIAYGISYRLIAPEKVQQIIGLITKRAH